MTSWYSALTSNPPIRSIQVSPNPSIRKYFCSNLKLQFQICGKVNVNATVTSNFAQMMKKATCLMIITQYNSNNNLTPEFKWALFEKRINLDGSHKHAHQRWRKIYDPKFIYGLRSNINTGTNRYPRQNTQLIHDPQCSQNPRIRSSYDKNPQSATFSRQNPSIWKPIHPPPPPSPSPPIPCVNSPRQVA